MATASGPTPDPMTGPGVHDHDLDFPMARPRDPEIRGNLIGYQRLVANPFLAILGILAWYALFRHVVQSRRLDLFFPALGSLGLIYFLFQYHCLDCGATGWLARWRNHACTRAMQRKLSGAPPRYRTLTPVAQTMLWFYLLIVGSIFGFIVYR